MPRPLFQETGFYLRVYDGASPRHYAVIPLLEPPTLTVQAPKPEETLIENSGRIDEYSGYIITSETPIFQPLDFTLEFRIISSERSRVNALGNPLQRTPWLVGTDTWIPVDPLDIGTRQNSQGEEIVPPSSAVFSNVAYMVDIYYYYAPPASDLTSPPMIFGRQGCICESYEIPISNREVHAVFNMKQFGGFDKDRLDWPDGTESIAN